MFERLFRLMARFTNNSHTHSYTDQTVSFTLQIPVVLSYREIDACTSEEQLRELLVSMIRQQLK